jgi:predicted NAD/FAD-binding protein
MLKTLLKPFIVVSLFGVALLGSVQAEQQRVAIIGGGGAGLTSAWLLEQDYDVTLFEKNDRLGGHCHTIDVEHCGYTSHIDTGAEFFSDSIFPHFMQLLKILDVPVNKFVLTNTFFTIDGSETIYLPPITNGKVAWESFWPSNLFDLLQFKHVLTEGQYILDIRDTGMTLSSFVEDLKLTHDFKIHFLYPFMAAAWGVTPQEIQKFAAYDVLKYFVLNQPSGLDPIYWNEIVGGTRAYIKTLSGQLKNADIRLSASIQEISYENEKYFIKQANGTQEEFDHLVITTNAKDAAKLLKDIPQKQDIRAILDQIRYYDTTIAIHGDKRFMPKDPSDWAIANVAYNGKQSAMTFYKDWLDGPCPLFRSWLTYNVLEDSEENPRPSPLYATIEWEHPFIDINYFHAQKAVQTVNGNHNLWFAGIHTYDNDSHESVICSAIKIAQGLAPESTRLKKLTNID